MRYVALLFLLIAQTASAQCGVERWAVKALLDQDTIALHFVQAPSLAAIDTFAPRQTVNENTPRMDFETQIVTVRAKVLQMKRESDDNDIHLLLQDDSGYTMIAEVPDPDDCPDVATSSHADNFRGVREYIASHFGTPTTRFKDVNQTVQVTGVLFQDFPHNQTGAAPNYREIHPVLMLSEPLATVDVGRPLKEAIEIVPNPAQTRIHVKAAIEKPAKIYGFQIVDVSGHVLMLSHIEDTPNGAFDGEFRIDNLPNGTYYLELQTNIANLSKSFVVKR